MANDIVKVEEFAALKMDPGQLHEVLTENLGNTQLSAFELDRVKIPSGGATTWEIPTLEGAEEKKSIEGVVIFFKDPNGYWKNEYDGQNNPPDCVSDDGMVGVGKPGGNCAACPLNAFGSDGEKGKACKNMRTLFILREEDILPIVVTLPPTSLREARKYFLRLASKGVPYYSVVTELTLVKEKNNDGIQYSKACIILKSRMSAEAAKKIKAFQENLRPALEAVQVEPESHFPEEDAV